MSNGLCGEGWGGRVDPNGLRESLGLWRAGDEALGMSGPGLAEDCLAAGKDLVGPSELDLFGGEHRDAPVAVLGVVPQEERATERLGLVLVVEPS